MADTQSQTAPDTSNIGAIIGGMGLAPARDQTSAPLPDILQPGYQPPQPPALQLPQGPVSLQPPPAPPQPAPPQPAPAQPALQPPAQPQPQVATASQPGPPPPRSNLPWPAANPNSPTFRSAQDMPALPGETPQETQQLNAHAWHETGSRGNIINDLAARNPALYTDRNNPRTGQGYWQDVNSTWAAGARLAGVDLRQFPTALTADYWTQRRVNLALYRAYGDEPWKPHPDAGEVGDRFALRPQLPLPPERRDQQDWGSPPPRDFGPGPTGRPFGQAAFMEPGQSGFTRVLNAIGPLLMGIGSLALHLPLSTAITAYGAMAKAQDNGQREAYERARTQFQDQLKEANAQQTLESQAASDAFAEYGTNNPEGLQQELARIALQYNDPTMYRMAEKGDLNGIHQLQTKRDQYNQDLTKLNKANEDAQDRKAQDDAVAAMDRQYLQDHPNATADELAIAHNENIGKAARAGTKDPKAAGETEDAQPYEVRDKTTHQPIRQVRLGRNGGLFDLTGQPTQLGPNEELGDKVGAKSSSGETKASDYKDYTWEDQQGKKHGPSSAAMVPGKGLVDPQGNPIDAKPDSIRTVTAGTPSQDAEPKPSDYKDYTWDDPEGKHHGPSSAAMVPGKGLVDPMGNPIPAKPETIRTVSAASSTPAESYPHDAGAGNYDDKPNRPPPGTDITDGEWRQALTYVNTGKAPTFARDKQSMARFREIIPVAMRAMGVTEDQMDHRWVDYKAYQTRQQRIEAAFAGGQDGKTLLALNTIAHHIDLFRQYAAAMRAHDQPAMNAIIDNIARQGGAAQLLDMNIVSRVTGDELVRVLTGTGGGTITDREDIAHQLSSYSSPEQFEGVANTLTNVIRGRFGPLQRAYSYGDPAKEKFFRENMMEPEARHMFTEEQAPIPGASSVPPMTEQQYNSAPSGTRYRLPTDPPNTVRVKP